MNGYVWQHFATLGSSWLGPLDSIWEHPNRIELETKDMRRFTKISQSRRLVESANYRVSQKKV